MSAIVMSLFQQVSDHADKFSNLIDNYLTDYTAENTSLEDVANGIPYDTITATVATKKVRFVQCTVTN